MERIAYILPKSFTFDLLRKADPICAPCDEDIIIASDDSKANPKFKQYEIEDVKNIWYRVVCVNDVGLSQRAAKNSFLSPTGHIDRMNVWTHLFAMTLFILFVLVRLSTDMGARRVPLLITDAPSFAQ
eukprot:1513163-Prymnesium_polylepis.1